MMNQTNDVKNVRKNWLKKIPKINPVSIFFIKSLSS